MAIPTLKWPLENFDWELGTEFIPIGATRNDGCLYHIVTSNGAVIGKYVVPDNLEVCAELLEKQRIEKGFTDIAPYI